MQPFQLKTAFENLGVSNDLVSIKSALHGICSEFGLVNRLDVLPASQGGKRQALCFLRMESAEQEQQIMRILDIARFDGELIVVVDLHEDSLPQRFFANQHGGVPLSA